MNFPTAQEIRQQQQECLSEKTKALKEFITSWLNSHVFPEIQNVIQSGFDRTNITCQVPSKMCSMRQNFYAEVSNQLTPLGYTVFPLDMEKIGLRISWEETER